MHYAATNEATLQLSGGSYERVAAWVANELREEAYNGIVAAVLFCFAWLAANVFMIVLLSAIFVQFLRFSGGLGLAPILAIAVLGAAYPLQYFAYRRTQNRVKLRTGIVTLPQAEKQSEPMMQQSDPWDGIADALINLTAFPAWLAGSALRYSLAPMRASRADNHAIGRVLLYLLETGRRASLFDVEDAVPLKNTAAALNLVVHMQGVLVWQSDFPAISINDDLRDKLAQLI
jgi:hypothetical protein